MSDGVLRQHQPAPWWLALSEAEIIARLRQPTTRTTRPRMCSSRNLAFHLGVWLLALIAFLLLTSTARADDLNPYSARADCIVTYESHWSTYAINPRSGASGLGQFLPSTWATTPYAARSVFDPWANHAAVCWMLSQGRAREFEVVLDGLC